MTGDNDDYCDSYAGESIGLINHVRKPTSIKTTKDDKKRSDIKE